MTTTGLEASARPEASRQDLAERRLRVCHVTTTHLRHDPRIFLKECVSLANAGHDVHLVIGDGAGEEYLSGVTIHDMGQKPRSRVSRMWAQVQRAGAAVEAIHPDVVHVHDPELLPLAHRLARRGVLAIFDSHEDFPGQIRSKRWIPAPLRHAVSRAFAAYQTWVVRRLHGVVAATPHIAGTFAFLGGRVVCVNNYPFPDEMEPPETGERGRQVCYVGGISRARGVEVLVRALPAVTGARLVLCGPFIEAGLEASLRAEPGWRQVEYRGPVDRAEVSRVLAKSSVGVVTYFPEPNHLEAQPTKLYEYMAAELPVVASDFPHWRTIVADTGAGLCVRPDSPEAVATALSALLDNPALARRMGKAGRAAVLARYSWPAEGARLVAYYAQLSRQVRRLA